MLQRYLELAPQVDPTAYVHAAAVLIGDVTIGPESTVWPHATLRGDDGAIRVGSQTSIQDGAVIHATEGRSRTTIGDRVTIGHLAIIHGATIESDVIVGMGSIVMDNARVGAFSLIGAGTLITADKEIPPRSLVMGRPGKVVRPVTDEEIAWIAYSWGRYVEQGRRYRGAP